MLRVGQPVQVHDALGAALKDLRGLAAREIVNPYRERTVSLLVSLGRICQALAVGRERRQSVLGSAGGARAGDRVGDRHDWVVAPDVNRGRLARDAFRLRTFGIAVVDVGISAYESDRTRRRRAMGNRREDEL